jgi:hypothetical protein
VFTSIVVGLGAVAYLFWQRGRPREVIDRSPKDGAGEVPVREDDHRSADPG